jgi:hypothetical protein
MLYCLYRVSCFNSVMLSIIMLSVIILSVIMLSVLMLSVIRLSVVMLKVVLHGCALALLASIRLGWKGLPGTNTLAY